MNDRNIPIEEYKGFEISYDADQDKFLCIIDITSEEKKARTSLKDLRVAIDDYIKANKTFKPFYVIHHPEHGHRDDVKRIKVVGIRKDGIFVYEEKDEKEGVVKRPFSKYYHKDYILDIPENEKLFTEIEKLNAEAEAISKKTRELHKKVKRTTLEDLKKNYQ